jgi:hypothetical protein
VRPSWLITAILVLVPHSAAAQVPSVRVDSTRGQLEVVFPAFPLSNSGCRYSGNVSAETGRLYSWTVSAPFPDSRYPKNHIFELWFHFFFPDTVELTEARFDSIVALNPPRVAELYGEPPSPRIYHHLDQFSLYRDNGRLTLLIQGPQPVNALLGTGATKVGLSWCEGSRNPQTFRVVQLDLD